ncbi:MAG TPA: hypothetical protein PLG47_04360 [Candidatus Dojkabacteria bacterium]|nr:hypothetical protein [Candidatus Dojkabacteria bacterium]
MTGTLELKLNKPYFDIMVRVEYEYGSDSGVHTFPNGDPGYPGSEEIDIEGVFTEDNVMHIMDLYTAEQLKEELMDKISEHENK